VADPGAGWPFGHLGNARWAATAESKMFKLKKPTVILFAVFCGLHRISDMGRELNKMGDTAAWRSGLLYEML